MVSGEPCTYPVGGKTLAWSGRVGCDALRRGYRTFECNPALDRSAFNLGRAADAYASADSNRDARFDQI